MLGRIVIVGAGQAAAQAVDTLRRKGFKDSIVLVGDEPHVPYQRPPLSKKYLAGALEAERLLIRPAHFYSDHGIDLRLGRRVSEIDRSAKRVGLDDGTTLDYDSLLLATGARPRGLTCPGSSLPGVHFLRTLTDVDGIRREVGPGRRLVIVGGGYIGLEVAASCHELGVEVTVLEMAARVMNRVTCAEVSEFYEAEHRRHGVNIVCNARVRALVGSDRVRAVACEDGSEYAADVVVVGVGVAPADELAVAAGIECANGIVVDEFCRTSDPHVYAAGDCTNHPSAHYGCRLRLESVDNAFEQGTSAALNMLGTPTPHHKVPWFWSDQFDLRLVIVGLSQTAELVVMRGDPGARSFSMCYLRAGELVAIDTVNSMKDQMAARKLIPARVCPNVDKLADATIALKDCV
jgi:3-phenylpropionate/trans-cinnamate dioxygenase ferredoxin reductase subunit